MSLNLTAPYRKLRGPHSLGLSIGLEISWPRLQTQAALSQRIPCSPRALPHWDLRMSLTAQKSCRLEKKKKKKQSSPTSFFPRLYIKLCWSTWAELVMLQLKKTAAVPWGRRGTSWPLAPQALSLPIKERKKKDKQTPSHPQHLSPFLKAFNHRRMALIFQDSSESAARQMGLVNVLQVSIQVSVWVFGSCTCFFPPSSSSFFSSSQLLHSRTSGSYSACKCKRLNLEEKKKPSHADFTFLVHFWSLFSSIIFPQQLLYHLLMRDCVSSHAFWLELGGKGWMTWKVITTSHVLTPVEQVIRMSEYVSWRYSSCTSVCTFRFSSWSSQRLSWFFSGRKLWLLDLAQWVSIPLKRSLHINAEKHQIIWKCTDSFSDPSASAASMS